MANDSTPQQNPFLGAARTWLDECEKMTQPQTLDLGLPQLAEMMRFTRTLHSTTFAAARAQLDSYEALARSVA